MLAKYRYLMRGDGPLNDQERLQIEGYIRPTVLLLLIRVGLLFNDKHWECFENFRSLLEPMKYLGQMAQWEQVAEMLKSTARVLLELCEENDPWVAASRDDEMASGAGLYVSETTIVSSTNTI